MKRRRRVPITAKRQSLAFGTAGVRPIPIRAGGLINDSTRETHARLRTQARGRANGRLSRRSRLGETGVITQASTLHAMQQRERFQDSVRERLALTAQGCLRFHSWLTTRLMTASSRPRCAFHGRTGVPIAYSGPRGWAASRLRYDRESSEFTVTHLRHFIRAIAECPDVERVHLVAHSRGCDALISALRELHIGYRAQDKITQQELKLENLVLAAPDVDEEIFMQRFVGENMLQVAKRTTIYASQHDKAIELADVVFASRRRLGMLSGRDFSPKMRHALAKYPNVQFIEYKPRAVDRAQLHLRSPGGCRI